MDEANYVLVVDDDTNALALMSVFVRSLGLEVRAVDCGLEALSIMREQPPGLIVLDLMMPGMSGFDVLRHVQFNPGTRDTPILILTAANVERHNIPDLRKTVVGIFRKADTDYAALAKAITQAMNSKSSRGTIDRAAHQA